MKGKQLYKSSENKIFTGVCGGIAEYFNVDPTIVRIVFVLAALLHCFGVVIYITAVIIMPEGRVYTDEDVENMKSANTEKSSKSSSSKKTKKTSDSDFNSHFE